MLCVCLCQGRDFPALCCIVANWFSCSSDACNCNKLWHKQQQQQQRVESRFLADLQRNFRSILSGIFSFQKVALMPARSPSLSHLLILMLSLFMLCLFSGVWLQESCARHTIDAAGRQALRLRHQRTQSQGLCYLCEYTKTPSTSPLLPPLPLLPVSPCASIICLFSLVKDKFLWLWQRKFLKRFSAKVSNEALCVSVCGAGVCAGVCMCVLVLTLDHNPGRCTHKATHLAFSHLWTVQSKAALSPFSLLFLPLPTSTLYKLYNSCCCTSLVVKIVISVCSSCSSSNPKAACNAYKSNTPQVHNWPRLPFPPYTH